MPLAMHSYSRSHNKDSGHANRSAVAEKTIYCTQNSPLYVFYKQVTGDGIFNLRVSGAVLARSFTLREYALSIHFAPVTLTLTQ